MIPVDVHLEIGSLLFDELDQIDLTGLLQRTMAGHHDESLTIMTFRIRSQLGLFWALRNPSEIDPFPPAASGRHRVAR
jgi:hypothetical protein